MRPRMHWASAALVLVLVTGGILFMTGRLQIHWRPAAQSGSADDGHDHGKEEKGEEEGRVVGDKALLDADAIKAAGIRTAPVEKGSVAVALQVTGEVELPDQRLANVTARLPGVIREVYRARGDRVVVGTPLCAIESAELGEARAAYVAALADARVVEANSQAWQSHGRARGGEAGSAAGWVELEQALAEQAAAQAERAVAERNLARMRELQERGLRSRTETLTAEADVSRATVRSEGAARRLAVLGAVAETEKNRALARVEAAATKLKALGVEPGEIAQLGAAGRAEITSRFVVKSPIAGIVAEQLVTVGQTVDAASKIFTVMDLSQLWVTGALHDRDVAAVRPGVAAVVHIEGLNGGVERGGVNRGFKGRVVQIGPQVDEKTRTLPVRVAIQNVVLPGGGDTYALRPGMFAMVDLETARKRDVLVVPAAAVQTIGGKPVVFVETALTEGAAFERRPVVLGARDADVAEVTEGLRPGERVVVANAYLLKSEFERAKISPGHAH